MGSLERSKDLEDVETTCLLGDRYMASRASVLFGLHISALKFEVNLLEDP